MWASEICHRSPRTSHPVNWKHLPRNTENIAQNIHGRTTLAFFPLCDVSGVGHNFEKDQKSTRHADNTEQQGHVSKSGRNPELWTLDEEQPDVHYQPDPPRSQETKESLCFKEFLWLPLSRIRLWMDSKNWVLPVCKHLIVRIFSCPSHWG